MKRIICVIGMVITLLCVPTETVIAAECVNQLLKTPELRR